MDIEAEWFDGSKTSTVMKSKLHITGSTPVAMPYSLVGAVPSVAFMLTSIFVRVGVAG